MSHQLGPILRVANIRKAYVVHKDYDGNAPDGPPIIVATKELGEQVSQVLKAADADPYGDNPGHVTEARDTLPEELRGYVDSLSEASFPFASGCEDSAVWVCQESEAEERRIATTLREALAQISD